MLVRLGVDDEREADFDCGVKDLNEFFFEDSAKYYKQLMAVTYVWINDDDQVTAFLSISNDSISKKIIEPSWISSFFYNLKNKCQNRKLLSLLEFCYKKFNKSSGNSAYNRAARRVNNEKRLTTFPAVKIGRLAVHKDFQKIGIGTIILDRIKDWFTDGENKTGCRFIVVDALNNAETINFYRKNKFKFLLGDDDKDEHTRLMFFDLITVKP